MIEARAPWIVRAKTSRPCRSSPNQCLELGDSMLRLRSAAFGSIRVKRPGKAAIRMNRMMRKAEIQKIGRRLSSSQASSQSPRGRSPVPALLWASCSLISDPWVENAIYQVDDEVGEDVDQDEEGGDRDDHRRVQPQYVVVHQTPQTVDVEDAFGDHRTHHQGPRSSPIRVTIGMRELRSRCTPMTRRGGMPLAMAVRT